MSQVKETKIIRSFRRSMSMQILPDNTLVVKAPVFLPKGEIERFIRKHDDWINKKLEHLKNKTGPKKYIEGEEFWYLGDKVKLKIGDYKEIKVHDGHLLLPEFMAFRAKKEIEFFYIKQAKDLIHELLIRHSKELNTSYKSVTFSNTSSKWGSCTHDNRLQFCWRLIMAPLLVIRYVVVHELAHTTEKNHSREFYRKVASINPSFKQQIKWLKINGNKLSI